MTVKVAKPARSRIQSRQGSVQMKELDILTDETVLQYYEHIRDQVVADARSGGRYRFMGLAAKERASTLVDELRRRRLVVSPIDWPEPDKEE